MIPNPPRVQTRALEYKDIFCHDHKGPMDQRDYPDDSDEMANRRPPYKPVSGARDAGTI